MRATGATGRADGGWHEPPVPSRGGWHRPPSAVQSRPRPAPACNGREWRVGGRGRRRQSLRVGVPHELGRRRLRFPLNLFPRLVWRTPTACPPNGRRGRARRGGWTPPRVRTGRRQPPAPRGHSDTGATSEWVYKTDNKAYTKMIYSPHKGANAAPRLLNEKKQKQKRSHHAPTDQPTDHADHADRGRGGRHPATGRHPHCDAVAAASPPRGTRRR